MINAIKYLKTSLSLLIISFLFVSCGSNGSTDVTKKGVFLDASYVAGFKYKCGNKQGVTDSNGIFLFDSKVKKCEFYLGANKFIITPAMLQDRIITPFEVTTSTDSALQLSTVIQSLGIKKGDTLSLERAKVDKLPLLDLTNPVQVSSSILSVGANVKPLFKVKEDLSKNYDLKTGKILTEKQKQAQKTIETPTVPKPCTSNCDEPKKPDNNQTTPPPNNTSCPIGATCESSNEPSDEDDICLPGVKCSTPKSTQPCFPGSDCDNTSASKESCLPGQSCDGTTINDTSSSICLPGQSCNNSKPSNTCLPGSPCDNTATNNNQPPSSTGSNDENICLPGAICAPQTPSNQNQTSKLNNNTQNTTNNNKQCLPGQVC